MGHVWALKCENTKFSQNLCIRFIRDFFVMTAGLELRKKYCFVRKLDNNVLC